MSMNALVGSSRTHHQMLRFLTIGAANTLFSYALYSAALYVGLAFYLASLLALCVGVSVSFVTQGRLVFRSRLDGRFGMFVIMWALLYFANIGLIRVFAAVGLNYYVAGLVAMAPVTALSFLLQRHIVFAARRWQPIRIALCTLLLIFAMMRLHMVFGFEIHWDEFLNLSMVHDHQRGDLHEILQTAFVHLFAWLPGVAVNEVDQVIAGRALVFVLALVTSLAIYRIARRFMSVEAALFAVLAYNAFSFTFRHGVGLRTDPLATCCMMVALWLAVSERQNCWRAVALGALVGLAGTLTIKAVFYVPVIAIVMLIRVAYDADRRSAILAMLISGAMALVTFATVLFLHARTLADAASPFSFVARTSGKTVATVDYSIFVRFLETALLQNLVFWIVLAIGLIAAAARLRVPAVRRDGMMILSLSLLLLTPLVYRDIYPYYYPFMLAPAAVVVGFGFEQLLTLKGGRYAKGAMIVLAATTIIVYVKSIDQPPDGQRRTLAVIHGIFPEPVPYIDSPSMVSAYPKRGLFMSTWGMTDYRMAGRPIMDRILREDQPRFLLANNESLDLDRLDPATSSKMRHGLMAADIAVLKSAFVNYWGPIYVPGFKVDSADRAITVRIPGSYRLMSRSPMSIDREMVRSGEIVYLSPGIHGVSASSPVVLQWKLPPPPAETAHNELFTGF